MAKQIKFTFDGKEYTLEFTRRTVRQTEQNGFNIQALDYMPVTMVPKLFAGAFLKHHGNVKGEILEKIYDSIPDKEGFLGALAEMYSEPLESLMVEPEDESKNVNWEKSW